MVARRLTALIAVAALAVPAPAARASHATYDCGFLAVRHDVVTGGHDTYAGLAYGYVTSPVQGEAVSIRCTVTVDGALAAATDPGTGSQAAAAAGQVVFTAAATATVRVCAVWSVGAESGTDCDGVTRTQVPARELLDLVNDVAMNTHDPLLCPVLATLGALGVGVPGVLDINAQGDVRLIARAVWDCPPYDIEGEDTGLAILQVYLIDELER